VLSKIQDEFISMYYEGRENLELCWFEGDILAVQEAMTVKDDDGQGRCTGWSFRGTKMLFLAATRCS
jgi:hypothetical protein